MKYSEMTKFLYDNGIYVIQPAIADALEWQLEKDITDDEFENICDSVYNTYLSYHKDEPDVWNLVNEELISRGLI